MVKKTQEELNMFNIAQDNMNRNFLYLGRVIEQCFVNLSRNLDTDLKCDKNCKYIKWMVDETKRNVCAGCKNTVDGKLPQWRLDENTKKL